MRGVVPGTLFAVQLDSLVESDFPLLPRNAQEMLGKQFQSLLFWFFAPAGVTHFEGETSHLRNY
jgi:hypothetical protein